MEGWLHAKGFAIQTPATDVGGGREGEAGKSSHSGGRVVLESSTREEVETYLGECKGVDVGEREGRRRGVERLLSQSQCGEVEVEGSWGLAAMMLCYGRQVMDSVNHLLSSSSSSSSGGGGDAMEVEEGGCEWALTALEDLLDYIEAKHNLVRQDKLSILLTTIRTVTSFYVLLGISPPRIP